jgi:hypothetical protein
MSADSAEVGDYPSVLPWESPRQSVANELLRVTILLSWCQAFEHHGRPARRGDGQATCQVQQAGSSPATLPAAACACRGRPAFAGIAW